MKKSKFTEEQIAFTLKQAEMGARVEDVCRELDISEATFYNRRKKCGGPGASELRRLKQLEAEKQMVADPSLDKHMLQDVVKSFEAEAEARAGGVSARELSRWRALGRWSRTVVAVGVLLQGASA